jgi:putative resolvase
MRTKYPDHIIIKDIASGINMNRKGLNKIIDYAIEGRIGEVVIAYKDRLARFGYTQIERLIEKYSGGKIIVLNKRETKDPKEELVDDVLQIMNVFVAKMNGMRKYKNN